MAINEFDVQTTRRLSIGLLSASGALLFTALNLTGTAITSGQQAFASEVANSILPLFYSAASALISLIFAELASHPKTPDVGHPHSKGNYLQSAFVIISLWGLGALGWGSVVLISAVKIAAVVEI